MVARGLAANLGWLMLAFGCQAQAPTPTQPSAASTPGQLSLPAPEVQAGDAGWRARLLVADYRAAAEQFDRMHPHPTEPSLRFVRARIAAISEVPAEWAGVLDALRGIVSLDDGPLENLLWQAVVGAWPISRERLHAYAEKAAREAGDSTNWTEPDAAFEQRLHALVDAVFDDERVQSHPQP